MPAISEQAFKITNQFVEICTSFIQIKNAPFLNEAFAFIA